MYVKRRYEFWMTFNWSKKPFIYGLLYAGGIVMLYFLIKNELDFDISMSWQPISVIGIAVAFYLGFKNNASYDRTWEARKIWGGIVNNSRAFGVAVNSFIQGENAAKIKKELIYRHIAWLTALRFQLRLAREWEHKDIRLETTYFPAVCEAYMEDLETAIQEKLTAGEFDQYKNKANMAAQILNTQAIRLQSLKDQDYFDDFRHMEFHKLITEFYADQGRSERIKNFPFPRQYASVAFWINVIFAILIPFGLINIFKEVSTATVWLSIPFAALITWVFFLMEMIGDYSENPFEGSYNDVPITSIARGIEIDLREMLNDENIPKPIVAENGFLM